MEKTKKDSGWLKWEGGECPVPEQTAVEYETRKGSIGVGIAKDLRWKHLPLDGDILAYRILKEAPTSNVTDTDEDESIPEYTGGSSSYYKVDVANPVSAGDPYTVECQDVIEALDMSFSEGNIFKAIWRICAAKKGKAKKGYVDSVYDLEKIIFFAQRELQIEKMKRGTA